MSLFRPERKKTADRLRELLSENLPRSALRSDLQPGTVLRELGVDSLGLILIVTRFCEEFDVRIETLDANLGELRTIGDLIAAGERVVERRNRTDGNGSGVHE
jgi:acyl carrier protein